MTRLGKYEILEEIGRGGFAVVYQARDTTLDRVVALKVLRPHWLDDPDFVTRFHHEARAAANLRHPNIVTVHEAGEANGQLYIAMEYLPGCTLRELLEAEGALPLERALPILEGLAEALDYAHGQGVVHRDVKPGNVIVEETERGVQATLMDFGLVKAMGGGTVLTSQGTLLGSPEYMAPEQADPERAAEIGPAADRYALGIVAYQTLTGRVPFPGNTPATLYAHEHKPVPHPYSLRPDLPEQVAAALLKMLAKAPADRFIAARTFVARLRAGLLTESQIRQRETQLTSLYERLQAAAAVEDWPKVLALGEQIRVLASDHRDVPELMEQAEAQIRRPARTKWAWTVGGVVALILIVGGVLMALTVGSNKDTRAHLPTAPSPTKVAVVTTAPATLSPALLISSTVETPVAASPIPGQTPILSPEIGETPALHGATAMLPTPTPWPCAGYAPSHWELYTVQRGDTLYSLARRHGTTMDLIILYNCLQSTQSRVGQRLYLPPIPMTPTQTAISTEEAIPSLGDTWTRPTDEMVMVYVPAGMFQMGSDDDDIDYAMQLCSEYLGDCGGWFENEQPVHTVTLDSFWIDRTEVTNAQYKQCVDAGACQAPTTCTTQGEPTYEDVSKADHPVVCVDWYGARAYCEWIGARLPTEAEWEYAARGPNKSAFLWGATFDGTRLNFCDVNCINDPKATNYDDGYERTAPVGSFDAGASWCGALDMAGNVWEWTSSWLQDYPYRADDGREDPTSSRFRFRVYRGGSWNSSPIFARSAHRGGGLSDYRLDFVSFRCVGATRPLETAP